MLTDRHRTQLKVLAAGLAWLSARSRDLTFSNTFITIRIIFHISTQTIRVIYDTGSDALTLSGPPETYVRLDQRWASTPRTIVGLTQLLDRL